MIEQKFTDLFGALETGTDCIINVIDHIFNSIVPTTTSIIIAAFYLTTKFGWVLTSIIAIQLITYTAVSECMTKIRCQQQKFVSKADDDLKAKGADSMHNIETVKCYGNETFEQRRYYSSLELLMKQQYKVSLFTTSFQAVQQFIVCAGMLACSLILLQSISTENGSFKPGDFALLITHLSQLNGSVRYLAGYYR